MGVMQKHYPEFTRKVVIINAPMAFSAVWSAFSLGLPQRVLDKVSIQTHSFFIFGRNVPKNYANYEGKGKAEH